ncbi:Traf-like family protein [Thalictrum thalictroides]|uniref:Traf-like family protein n=1 Tax=Thalictrum thalictroides TaxID=46969 RepID=A0A7J6VTP8_THATH|nr:Traf-like family protein [Thalictrum thalictroides]
MAEFQSIPNDKEGPFESIRDDPPTHFTFSIQSFSLITKCSIEKYETSIFEAGGYKCKLEKASLKECLESEPFTAGDHRWIVRMYPSGFGDGKGNSVSLYLVLVESSALPAGRMVYADFTLRLMNQASQKIIQSKGNYWFSASKEFSGWPKFLAHNYLGLLKDNFGVEAEVTVMGVVDKLP